MTTGSHSWLEDRSNDPDDPGRDEEREQSRRRRDRRILGWLALVVLVMVGGVYFAGHWLASDRLPRATTIAGVSVGGLAPRDAEVKLQRELADLGSRPVTVAAADQEFELVPDDVGLEVDIAASVDQVPVGQSWQPAEIWESFVGGEDYEPVVITIDDLLIQGMEKIADKVDEDPVEGTVRFRADGAEPVYPELGRRLDVPAAAAAVTAAFPTKGGVVPLPVRKARFEVTAREVSRAMQEFANPAMSGSIVYSFGREQVVLRPQRFARALSVKNVDGTLKPRVDRAKLLAVFKPAARAIAREPRDATVRIVDGRPRVIPSRKGAKIDRDRVVAKFLDLAVASGSDRRVAMDPRLVQPAFATSDAKALGITERVSSFTTSYPHADYRNVNIGRAADIIDGTLLKPGDTFSLNDTVGERTRENGFTEGFIISDGVFAEELGGGVSQVATTTFNAAFFAGLEDVEHKPHSFYIDRYPVGREATVAWPVVDLKFKNDTGHGVLIQTLHTPSTPATTGSVTVRMWSTKIWDITSETSERYNPTPPETRTASGEDCFPNDGYDGFSIDVFRIFREVGSSEVVRREKFHTVYTPSDTVICQ